MGIVILLLALTHDQLAEVYEPGLGRLVGPRSRAKVPETAQAGWEWAADNDAFSSWSPVRFTAMLAVLAGAPGCRFVTAPDVVGDHAATLRQFSEWAPAIRAHGLPVAFVAQDGVTPAAVPWGEIDALFIGGSTPFKLGPEAATVAREAHRRGLWLHMGRVNSLRRMLYARSLECHSVDGTSFARWNHAHLDAGRRRRAAATAQLHLEVAE